MNTTTLPRLRDEVIVRPFDDGGTAPRYVVAIDGHHFVVTAAVAAVLDEIRARDMDMHAFETVAARVSHRLATTITPRQVETLVRERIPQALFTPAKDVNAEQEPLMCRQLLLSGPRLQSWLALAVPLFATRVAIAGCALSLAIHVLLALQVWSGGAGDTTAAGYWWSLALTLAGIFLHELGHLAACHRFGGQHGGIGVGIYWCLPAFYAEVHGAWTLSRRQRAAVDAGGVYLQFMFAAVLGVFYLVSHAQALLSAIVLTHVLMLHTLNPVLKFDGYWLLSDLAGIHNLHRRIRDVGRKLLRRGQLARSELALFAAFTLIALGYFTYLLVALGRNLGLAVASFLTATSTSDLSMAAVLAVLGQGMLLAFMAAMAFGVALLIARAGGALLMESSNES